MKTKPTNKKIEIVLDHILQNMATKDDLMSIKKELKNFATKDDLKKALAEHPTKKDLKRELDDLAIQITLGADKHKAEKRVVEALERRVDKIETTLQAH
ncbi:MAG: hypothetical protein Q7K55_06225 [Candidatus Levybacteria bacterium]|nr:hypothetical protein [Candidatus Levybacteria bacterium]